MYWSKKGWGVFLLVTLATLFTGTNPAVLPRAILQARDGLKAGMNLGQLIEAVMDYLKDANAYVRDHVTVSWKRALLITNTGRGY